MGAALQRKPQGGFEAAPGGDGTHKGRIPQTRLVLAMEGDNWTLADLQRKLMKSTSNSHTSGGVGVKR